MERAAWVWQFNQLGEQTAAQIAQTLVPRGITRVYAKAMDGPYWMAQVYSHPMAPQNAVHMAQLSAAFQQAGLQLIPWVVNRHTADEANAHLGCGRAAGGLVIDFEYQYEGFWQGSDAEAQAYFDQMRQAVQGGLWVAAAPDARQIGRDYSPDLIGGLSAYLPQNYWTDFKLGWDGVMQSGCQRCRAIGPTEPIVPHDATRDDIRQSVLWAEQQGFGSVSLWRMGPADAGILDAFASTILAPAGAASTAFAAAAAPDAPASTDIPQMYLDRGWTDWPTVAINLEGIIHQLLDERDDALAKLAAAPATG